MNFVFFKLGNIITDFTLQPLFVHAKIIPKKTLAHCSSSHSPCIYSKYTDHHFSPSVLHTFASFSPTNKLTTDFASPHAHTPANLLNTPSTFSLHSLNTFTTVKLPGSMVPICSPPPFSLHMQQPTLQIQWLQFFPSASLHTHAYLSNEENQMKYK